MQPKRIKSRPVLTIHLTKVCGNETTQKRFEFTIISKVRHYVLAALWMVNFKNTL